MGLGLEWIHPSFIDFQHPFHTKNAFLFPWCVIRWPQQYILYSTSFFGTNPFIQPNMKNLRPKFEVYRLIVQSPRLKFIRSKPDVPHENYLVSPVLPGRTRVANRSIILRNTAFSLLLQVQPSLTASLVIGSLQFLHGGTQPLVSSLILGN